jgi:hypothetical protein
MVVLLAAQIACPAEPTRNDAGRASRDAGTSDTGVADTGPSDAQCQGACAAELCVAERCLVIPAPECVNPADCGDNERCSVSGFCTSQACQTHGDCPASERCNFGACLVRVDPTAGVQLERLRIPALEAHQSVSPIPNEIVGEQFVGGAGFGLVLLDIDGDFDLDLFIGSEGGSPACLYRNDSRPAAPNFSEIESQCQPSERQWHGGGAIDLENDGFHELIRFSNGAVELQRFHPQASVTDLFEQIPVGDLRRACNAGSAISSDFDYDGRSDLVIGCDLDMIDNQEYSFRNLLFLQGDDGELHFVDGAERYGGNSPLLNLQSSTLALGGADINGDGLLDLIVSEDMFATVVLPEPDPGGVYLACPPDQNCDFTVQRFASGTRAPGGYMGSGLLRLGDSLAQHLYITDTGSNRLLRLTDNGMRDLAIGSNADIGSLGNTTIFSWGVVVDDFDKDGNDDILVANGSIPGQAVSSFWQHLDILLLQKSPGRFSWHSSDIGIDPFTTADSGNAHRPFASRGLLKADLDYDGYLELLAAGMEGAVRVHREIPIAGVHSLRCTLIPIPRYAPGFGVGHAIVSPDDERSRHWDAQGQLRSSASPFIVTPNRSGTLHFPSGAQVPYDCQNKPGPYLMIEPNWLRFGRDSQDGKLWLELDDAAPPGRPSVIFEGSNEVRLATPDEAGRWKVEIPEQARRFMIRFGQRWTARWWDLQ